MTCVSSFGPKYNIFCSMTSFITFSSPSPLLSRRHRHGRQYPCLAFPCYQIILLKFSYCALYIWYQHTYPKKSQVIKTIEQWLNLSPDITPFDFLQREFKKLVFVCFVHVLALQFDFLKELWPTLWVKWGTLFFIEGIELTEYWCYITQHQFI